MSVKHDIVVLLKFCFVLDMRILKELFHEVLWHWHQLMNNVVERYFHFWPRVSQAVLKVWKLLFLLFLFLFLFLLGLCKSNAKTLHNGLALLFKIKVLIVTQRCYVTVQRDCSSFNSNPKASCNILALQWKKYFQSFNKNT